ncbi:MAG: hypothetical protein HYY50_02805 [Candidatus Kerfeldbacteria bacterium]|nr:hypothetical protein [Candidatus Kerfeldbacteria bacterium]
MWHPDLSPPTSWPRLKPLVVTLAALLLLGQGCTIRIGQPTTNDGGVFRSDDHGQTWMQKTFVGRQKKRLLTISDVSGVALVFDPRDHKHIFLGTRVNGLWQTTDSGEHWQPTTLRAGRFDCLSFDPDNSQILYTASGSTVLKSTDGGGSWSPVYLEAQPGHIVKCVIVNPLAGNEIWALTSGGKLILSQDYGQRWTVRTTMTPLEPRRLTFDFDGSGRIYVFSTTGGIYVIRDHGTTVENLSAPLQSFSGGSDIRAVTIVSGPTPSWYLGTLYGLLVSHDRGLTWTSIPTLVTPRSVAIENVAVNPRQSDEIFIIAGQKLHRTTNGGTSWSVSTLPTKRIPTLLTFDPTDPDQLYISTLKPVKKKSGLF